MSNTSGDGAVGPQPSSSVTARQRQSKKDEAIRKKIEQELSKKRNTTSRARQTKKIAGTVSALRPSQALTVKENILVIEAAQLMAAKRSDCVLVVDDDDHLSGIFTAKDLAYRVVSEGLDARVTTAAEIMTKGPMCVTADTSATDALNLMVQRGFRHLPVCNEEGDIFGLLDITKCLYEALDKMERAFGSSRKLYDALEGVEKEWSNGPVQLVQYMEMLRDRMSCPDLQSVMDDSSSPVEVTVRTNVRETARLMKQAHTTAVLVMENGSIAGIFTSKDIVLRVVAAGLIPENCSVVRVMTPHPDTALPQTTILEALRKMHDGHYLNLPVVDEGKSVVGMVDVLKLTYATLEQMHSIQGEAGGQGQEGGPMWNKFWQSFGAGHDDDAASVMSDSIAPSQSASQYNPSTPPDRSMERTRDYAPIPPTSPAMNYSSLHNFPEISPNESASAIGEDVVSVNGRSARDDGTFAFKFKSAGGKVHRFTADYTSYADLYEIVKTKILPEHLSLSQSFQQMNGSSHSEDGSDWLTISYLDDEQDQVIMTSDDDLRDSVKIARRLGQDKVTLVVHDAAVVDASVRSATPPLALPESVPQTPSAERHSTFKQFEKINESNEEEEEEEEEEVVVPKKKKKSKKVVDEDTYPFPIPRDLILPVAIAGLSATIVIVFIVSRLTAAPHRR